MDKLEELKTAIQEIDPSVNVIVQTSDLSVTDQAYTLYSKLKEYEIDTWINNAGLGEAAFVADQNLDKAQTMLRVNIESLTILSTLYVRDYADVEGTQLINVSSALGYAIAVGNVAYSASKYYVSAFTEGLAKELELKGAKLKAKVLAPAITETEFLESGTNTELFKKIQVELNDVDIPQINSHEVLVKVKAAGVNPLDILNLNGSVRMIADYKLPFTLGNELSGVIEAVGDKVLNFKVGDPVYTRLPLNKIGAFAEYAAVNEDALSIMPDHLSFNEAAAVPLTALTAYQALHNVLHAQPKKKLFIPGGTGGFGAMAIPIAKSMGLYVITSGSERSCIDSNIACGKNLVRQWRV